MTQEDSLKNITWSSIKLIVKTKRQQGSVGLTGPPGDHGRDGKKVRIYLKMFLHAASGIPYFYYITGLFNFNTFPRINKMEDLKTYRKCMR